MLNDLKWNCIRLYIVRFFENIWIIIIDRYFILSEMSGDESRLFVLLIYFILSEMSGDESRLFVLLRFVELFTTIIIKLMLIRNVKFYTLSCFCYSFKNKFVWNNVFFLSCLYKWRWFLANFSRGRSGRDRMIVEIITTYAISAYHH
jgi:hypothetical protein